MKNLISRKKLLLGLCALAVCMVLAVISPWCMKWLTTPPDAYVYRSDKDYFVIRPDGSSAKLPAMTHLYDFHFDPTGTYLYYLDFDIENEDHTLYRTNYRKLTGDPDHDRAYVQEIAAHANPLSLKFSDDGRTLLYRTNDSVLYAYDGRKSVQIADNVTDAWFDGNRVAYVQSPVLQYDFLSYYNLYAVPIGAWDSPVLMAEKYRTLFSKDLDCLLYAKPEKYYQQSTYFLYQTSFCGLTKQIAENISTSKQSGNRLYYYTFKRTLNKHSICDLHYYENGRSHLVASDVVAVHEPSSNLLCFHTLDDLDRTIPQYCFLDLNSGRVTQLSEAAAKTLQTQKALSGTTSFLAFTQDALLFSAVRNYDSRTSTLWAAPIQADTTGDFKEITLDHYADSPRMLDDTLYYAEKSTDFANCWHIHTYRDGKNTVIIKNASDATLYEDGSWLVHRGTGSYTLQLVDVQGHVTTIAENVTKEWRISKEQVLYLRDGHLYEFDGKDSTLLAENANATSLWSPHQMSPVERWGSLY